MSFSVFRSTSRPDQNDVDLAKRQQVAAWHRNNLLIHTPSSRHASLATRVAITIDSVNLRPTWIAFTPSMVGWDQTADLALESLCHTTKYYLMPQPIRSPEILDDATKFYSKAVQSLSKRLQDPNEQLCDQILLAVSILSMVDFIAAEGSKIGSGDEASAIHYEALEKILLSRPQTTPASDLTRAILYLMQVRNFHLSLASGQPAKFDDPYFLTLTPSSLLPVREGLVRLRQLSWHTFTALPRLISYVRALRNPSRLEDRRWITAKAIALAEELLLLEDDESENYALHRLRVVPTEDDEVREVVRFAFDFASLEDMLAALSYWQGRLLVFRLRHYLQKLEAPISKRDQLQSIETRMIMNTMMTWPCLLGPGGMGSSPLVQSCIIVWGSLADKETVKSTPTHMIRAWIRRILLRHSGDFVVDDQRLNEASDVLVGGPLRKDALDSALPIPPTGAPVTTTLRKYLAYCQAIS